MELLTKEKYDKLLRLSDVIIIDENEIVLNVNYDIDNDIAFQNDEIVITFSESVLLYDSDTTKY